MKTKLIYSNFDQETGESTVAIENKYGVFYGFSNLHPEEENISSFVGCRYAEMRAWVKYFQYRKRLINEQIKGLTDFQKILKGTWSYDENSPENIRLRKRIQELEEEKEKYKKKIESIKQALKKSMDNRDIFVKKHLTK